MAGLAQFFAGLNLEEFAQEDELRDTFLQMLLAAQDEAALAQLEAHPQLATARNEYQQEPAFNFAACTGCLKTMARLLELGADISARDFGHIGPGKTALLAAAEEEQVAVICWVLERGSDVNESGGAAIMSPQAIDAGWPEEQHRAVIHGGQDGHWNDSGWTALMHAAAAGNVVSAAALLWRGADPTRRSRHGLSALDLAARPCTGREGDTPDSRRHLQHLLVWAGAEPSAAVLDWEQLKASAPAPLPREARQYLPVAVHAQRHAGLLCMLRQGQPRDVVERVMERLELEWLRARG